MKKLLNFMRGAYNFLFKTGYLRSVIRSQPVDRFGEPLPWYTYPAIEYLDSLCFKDKKVFEYGSGNSTIWWSKRCKSVTSIEDNQTWFEMVKSKLSVFGLINVDYKYAASIDCYLNALDDVFDIIIIDGKCRKECVNHLILQKLNNSATMIILDNSDWHPNAVDILRNELKWFEVDFSGFGPINPYTWTTSIWINPDLISTLKYSRKLRSIASIEQQDVDD